MLYNITLEHLGILVTTACNLNCRACADLIPKRERKIYKFEDVKRDLDKVLLYVDSIEQVLIVGGEPLLYPDLVRIIDYCGAQKKIKNLHIVTNGAIPIKEEVAICLKKNSVFMNVSAYPKYVVPNRMDFIETCKQIGLQVCDFSGQVWHDIGNADYRNRSNAELEMVFRTCEMKKCIMMTSEGKIFWCSRQASAYELACYPNPEANEYVDVRGAENLEDDIQNFLQQKYISTCNYCDGISCIKTPAVCAGIQMLKKENFLELLILQEQMRRVLDIDDKILVANRLVEFIAENDICLWDVEGVKEVVVALQIMIEEKSNNAWNESISRLEELVEILAKDYTYKMSEQFKCVKHESICNRPNTITVGKYPDDVDESVDILLTEEEVVEWIKRK